LNRERGCTGRGALQGSLAGCLPEAALMPEFARGNYLVVAISLLDEGQTSRVNVKPHGGDSPKPQ